jgi:hypothetical protein
LALPVTLPAGSGASWIIQARMAGAIASIAGYDLHSDRVRPFVVASLVEDPIKDIAKGAGIKIGHGLTKSLINQIPEKARIEINKKVGFRLITKAGEKGAVNLMKGVPFVGGIVEGAFDAGACRIVGKNAKRLFYQKGTSSP